ncbi:MAG: hydroxyisourate hydrolase [Pseudomonadota bacterium]
MSQITTHVLDTALGKPAAGIALQLFSLADSEDSPQQWVMIAAGVTDADGRVADLLVQDRVLAEGTYRMHFQTGSYHDSSTDTGASTAFYPYVDVVFKLAGDGEHYHIPLLLSPFAYSTYRGS